MDVDYIILWEFSQALGGSPGIGKTPDPVH